MVSSPNPVRVAPVKRRDRSARKHSAAELFRGNSTTSPHKRSHIGTSGTLKVLSNPFIRKRSGTYDDSPCMSPLSPNSDTDTNSPKKQSDGSFPNRSSRSPRSPRSPRTAVAKRLLRNTSAVISNLHPRSESAPNLQLEPDLVDDPFAPYLDDPDPNRTSFNLSNSHLTGSIPVDLVKLTALTHLNLYKNHLSGSIPRQLGKLQHLQELALDNNHLTGRIPPQLGKLKNLTHLCLQRNKLSGPIPEELTELKNLVELDLSHNRLTGSIPKELGSLKKLTDLYLHKNRLSGSIPRKLFKISKFYVNISFNYFTNDGIEFPKGWQTNDCYQEWTEELNCASPVSSPRSPFSPRSRSPRKSPRLLRSPSKLKTPTSPRSPLAGPQ